MPFGIVKERNELRLFLRETISL